MGCEVEEGSRQCGHLRGRVDGRDFQGAAGLHAIRRHCTCQGLRVLADISAIFSERLTISNPLDFIFCRYFKFPPPLSFCTSLGLEPQMLAVVNSYHFEASVLRQQVYHLLLAQRT